MLFFIPISQMLILRTRPVNFADPRPAVCAFDAAEGSGFVIARNWNGELYRELLACQIWGAERKGRSTGQEDRWDRELLLI